MDQHLLEALDRLLPDSVETYQKHCAANDARRAKLVEQLIKEAAVAVQLTGLSMRYPTISRSDIEQALAHLHGALAAAQELDPE